MKNIFALGILLFAELTTPASFAQKKVTVLGSSTAAGAGAIPIDSAWVWRLTAYFKQNSADLLDTAVNNRAVGGYVTYNSMPTGYSTPPDALPDPNANVTYVLNEPQRADVVIINYPTNDIVRGYTPKEMMDNLRFMFHELTLNGIRCFITTTQPRNSATDAQRIILRQLVDSININFGNYAINFWDDLVTNDGLYNIRPELLAPDGTGTHVNDWGHRLLFQRVLEKNIFGAIDAPLPLLLKNWQGTIDNGLVKLHWNTAYEEPGTIFEIQRSTNGKDFQPLNQIKGKGNDAEYSWTDASPLNGKSFYRLKIIEPLKTSYSGLFPIVNDKKQLVVSFYTDASQIHLQLNSNRAKFANLSLISSSGTVIKKQTVSITGSNNFSVPITELASGNYFLRITASDGSTVVERFAKLK